MATDEDGVGVGGAGGSSALAKGPRLSRRFLRGLGVAVAGVLFTAVLLLLRHELHHVDYHDIMRRARDIPRAELITATLFTALSYLALTVYDYLGLRYAGKPLPYRRTAFASFIAYVFSHNIGLSMFGGLAFRYRIYSSWDLTALDVAKVSLFCGATFWLGLLTLGGVVFTFWPPPMLAILPIAPWAFRLVGGAFLAAAGLYIAACWTSGGRPRRIWRWDVTMPSGRMALAQAGIASLDWALASSALYALMPDVLAANWFEFLSVYMLASVAGLIAHVPAGLGVIEAVVLMAFAGAAPADALLGSLLVFRAIYYLAPLAVAILWMAVYELAKATGKLQGLTAAARRWFEALIPRVFSVLVFASGVVLMLSGVMPAVEARRHWLAAFLPLALIEASHLLGNLTGAALLIVARGLQKRLESAFFLTGGLMAAGIVFSLVKGVDYEEALILSVALLLLAPCRPYFYRKASMLDARFSPGWIAAIGLSLLSMLWLGGFANKHVNYSPELWWTFTFSDDAARSMRAALGTVAAAAAFGVYHLLRTPKPAPSGTPASPEVRALVRGAERTYANLALLGDKTILLNEAKSAFIMYKAEGRSWVVMGDPVGAEADRLELIWRFRDLVDRYDGWPVFYQVDVENLRLYVEAGFSLLKIGEEAVIDLAAFTLEGRSFKHMRNTLNRLTKDGWQLEVLPAAAVDALLPELAALSDAWLAAKGAREKRFSLGFFAPEYLRQFPLAVARKDGALAAFANLWETDSRSELSVDLMRYGADAPPGIMDFMLVSLMQWGHREGYQTFNLGVAPFSGMDSRPLAPLWSRLGAKLYEHGERFYNFQGLREYKEKFDPTWRPKYLASPPGRALPVILANIATLVAGGLKGVVSP